MTAATQNHGLTNLFRVILFGGASLFLGMAVTEGWGAKSDKTATAILEMHRTAVIAGYDCQLAEIFVKAGDRVQEGDPLLRFTDERLEAGIQAKQRELSLAEVEYERAVAAAEVEVTWRRKELQQEIYQAELDWTRVEQERLSRQVEQIAWQEHLRSIDHWLERDTVEVSLRPVTVMSSRPDAARLQALLKEDAAAGASESLSRQLTRISERLSELKATGTTLDSNVRISAGVAVAEKRKQQIGAELSALQSQQAALTIHSSHCGIVGNWQHQPGDRLAAGDLVVELLDDAQIALVAGLPSTSIGLIQESQMVELLFPGNVRRAGIVGKIPPQVSAAATSSRDATIQLEIRPAGKIWPTLPAGSRVTVVLPARS